MKQINKTMNNKLDFCPSYGKFECWVHHKAAKLTSYVILNKCAIITSSDIVFLKRFDFGKGPPGPFNFP